MKFRCGILVLVGASSPVTPVGTWGGEVFCLLVVLTGLGFRQSNGLVPCLGVLMTCLCACSLCASRCEELPPGLGFLFVSLPVHISQIESYA